jgi:hypothetical protein
MVEERPAQFAQRAQNSALTLVRQPLRRSEADGGETTGDDWDMPWTC